MDRLDMANLPAEWRSGRDRRGNVLPPQVAEGKRICADELEAVLLKRYTLGTEVRVHATGEAGEIMGAYRVTRAHPIIYMVALIGGGEGMFMRDELEAQLPSARRPEINPLSPEAVQEVYSDIMHPSLPSPQA